MIAVLGTAVLSLSIFGFGFSYNSQLKAQRESLNGIIRLAERIKARIECFRSPLDEIYKDFTHPFLDSIGFTCELRENGLGFALVKTRSRLCLSRELFSEISEFAEGLGKSYADEQVRYCTSYINKLEKALSELDESIPVKTRMSLSLSAAGAAMAAILFL